MLLPPGAPPGNSRIPIGNGRVGPGAPRLEAEGPRARAARGRGPWEGGREAGRGSPRRPCAPAPRSPSAPAVCGGRRARRLSPAPAGPRRSLQPAGRRSVGAPRPSPVAAAAAAAPAHGRRESHRIRKSAGRGVRSRGTWAGGTCPAPERGNQAGALLPPSRRQRVARGTRAPPRNPGAGGALLLPSLRTYQIILFLVQ